MLWRMKKVRVEQNYVVSRETFGENFAFLELFSNKTQFR